MATYLILVTEDLMIPAILVGLMSAYARTAYGKKGSLVMRLGLLAGFIGSIIVSIIKNRSRKWSTGLWNVRIFTVSLIALVLFLILEIVAGRMKKKKLALVTASQSEEDGGEAPQVNRTLLPVFPLAVMAGVQVLYGFPDVLAAPKTILITNNLLSTDFLFRIIGLVLGLVLVFLVMLGAEKSAGRTEEWIQRLLLIIALLTEAVRQITNGLGVLLSRRMIKSTHTLFTINKFFANHSNFFLYILMALMLIAAGIMVVRSFHVNEPYKNPAQHRKIRAKWRLIRRWSAVVAVCTVLGILNLTWVRTFTNKTVELSPIEESTIENDCVVVPFEQVEDGHLHRFAYISEAGTEIRFIIIKKPNSSAFGVGMDACEICGETGYYERNGQIVCKLCDVIMNINTIGFPGGCNPLVVDYHLDNGKICVPIEALLSFEKEFK